MKKVGFVSLCTLILAYAGVSIGKDMDAFKSTGWRIVILSCVIFAGTYLGSAIIAQIILKLLARSDFSYEKRLAEQEVFSKPFLRFFVKCWGAPQLNRLLGTRQGICRVPFCQFT